MLRAFKCMRFKNIKLIIKHWNNNYCSEQKVELIVCQIKRECGRLKGVQASKINRI